MLEQDAAKFQHFKAETIVSDEGFKKLDPKESISPILMEKIKFLRYIRTPHINLDWDNEL